MFKIKILQDVCEIHYANGEIVAGNDQKEKSKRSIYLLHESRDQVVLILPIFQSHRHFLLA